MTTLPDAFARMFAQGLADALIEAFFQEPEIAGQFAQAARHAYAKHGRVFIFADSTDRTFKAFSLETVKTDKEPAAARLIEMMEQYDPDKEMVCAAIFPSLDGTDKLEVRVLPLPRTQEDVIAESLLKAYPGAEYATLRAEVQKMTSFAADNADRLHKMAREYKRPSIIVKDFVDNSETIVAISAVRHTLPDHVLAVVDNQHPERAFILIGMFASNHVHCIEARHPDAALQESQKPPFMYTSPKYSHGQSVN